jgi:hypothetical protein
VAWFIPKQVNDSPARLGKNEKTKNPIKNDNEENISCRYRYSGISNYRYGSKQQFQLLG